MCNDISDKIRSLPVAGYLSIYTWNSVPLNIIREHF